jgi:hypothetical protein
LRHLGKRFDEIAELVQGVDRDLSDGMEKWQR